VLAHAPARPPLRDPGPPASPMTKARIDPGTAAYLARKQSEGKSRREALRCLKRHLARRVFKLLQPTRPTSPAPLSDRPSATNMTGVMLRCNTPLRTPALT
jgi:hypothetical protein